MEAEMAESAELVAALRKWKGRAKHHAAEVAPRLLDPAIALAARSPS